MSRLDISVEQRWSNELQFAVLRIGGFVDVSTEDEFRSGIDSIIQQVLQKQVSACILSLESLAYLNSTGLAALVDTNRQLAERFALASVPDSVLQIAKLLGVDEHLNFFDTVDEAIEALS
ncbi:MAG: STAS domain-containing protein [Planctomycetota bacterium]|nr:STAS domain-containing protein [Planctomycetota bacterium]MDA1142264.1 STAS domain-containing protein [Planctomycetota bacterium]